MTTIPFNIPYLTGKEQSLVVEALKSKRHCGNHSFGQRCIALMQKHYGFQEVFLTPSCTAAMEMGALLADLQPGDEVILPSFTFSSTANSIVLRGAIPVFCEVCPKTMNIDVSKIEALITDKTKMILPIDYAGIPSDIDPIMEISKQHDLVVMLDGAQSYHSRYKNRPSGTSADLVAFSFHETKNMNCGEGGALIVNRPEWYERAHFLQEKGTDRRLVIIGAKNKYSWVDQGSSFLLADILAAMLLPQLESAEQITNLRANVSAAYSELFAPYASEELVQVPIIPDYATVNHHAFFVIFDTPENRFLFLSKTKEHNVSPYIGYLPLHSSPMGQRFGYKADDLPVTEDLAQRIVRLPFYTDLQDEALAYCVTTMKNVMVEIYGR